MTDLVLRGGRVIDPASGRDETADIAFGGGKITEIARALPASRAEIVDVAQKHRLRYSDTPGMTQEERRQAEPWNYPQEQPTSAPQTDARPDRDRADLRGTRPNVRRS
jgi:hypothetical protein